ncbi:helix-turn-helix domain-containing protein [Streptomyces sp. NPDC014894]|uniref:helix-turn-helix domain-containing protein n=1 Tax=Streptomyces sp. NPDC014894 TaxID=3364931 RepID=UPI0036FBE3B9
MPDRPFDGRAFRARRRAADLTQRQIAEAVGVQEAAVARWESETTKPLPETLPILARLLGMSLDTLFPREGKPDLADLRADAGYSQKDTIAITKASTTSSVRKAESGVRRLSDELVALLAAAYGVSERALRAAQERSFGNAAPDEAEGTAMPSSLAEKIRFALDSTYSVGSAPSDAQIAAAVNDYAGAAVVSQADIRDLRTGVVTEAVPIVLEGMADMLGFKPAYFQSEDAVTRQVVEGLTLLASKRRGDVGQIAARGMGAEGLPADLLAIVNEVVAEYARRPGPGTSNPQR